MRRSRASTHARRRRFIRATIVAVILLPAALWALDLSGPEELVEAQVLRTRFWRHRPANARPHNHTRAILIIEGLNEVNIDQADGFSRGQRVSVWVRRGRLSGYPYFQELASAEDLAAVTPPAEPGEAPGLADPQDLADPQELGDPNGVPLPEEEP
jgi:hypothetical protein